MMQHIFVNLQHIYCIRNLNSSCSSHLLVCFKHRVMKGCSQFLNVNLQGYFRMFVSCGVICGLHVMSTVLVSGPCLWRLWVFKTIYCYKAHSGLLW